MIARENDEACDECNAKVKFFDARGLPKKIETPKMLAEYLQFDSLHCRDAFCLAIRGKYDTFAQAYFDHMKNPEIDPCKVVHIC
ncbi:hypothetical protein DdX_11904 [Ditylenchus destructor]|uniref:Uncharacterized protein n=1 Tax=Ditylenchus destructor TaxID=166010 RepID=A0AAD4MZI8_9BILA|nr:hypothetical protein DdX_11904 [Ditylenchus destructor]